MGQKVMSLNKFLQESREKENKKIDKAIGKFTRIKKIDKLITLSLASYMSMEKAIYAVENVEKLDAAGNRLLNIVRYLGKFACLFFCFAEIIKSLAEGDVKSIVTFCDYIFHPTKILIAIWNCTVRISFIVCLLIALISIVLYLSGNKKFGKYVSGSILVYSLIQAINCVL